MQQNQQSMNFCSVGKITSIFNWRFLGEGVGVLLEKRPLDVSRERIDLCTWPLITLICQLVSEFPGAVPESSFQDNPSLALLTKLCQAQPHFEQTPSPLVMPFVHSAGLHFHFCCLPIQLTSLVWNILDALAMLPLLVVHFRSSFSFVNTRPRSC